MLKDTPYKWLDLVKFANEFILPNHCVEKILYFTVRVSGVVDSKSPARQQVYLNALNSNAAARHAKSKSGESTKECLQITEQSGR